MKNHFGLHKDPFSKQFLKETILSVENVLHFNFFHYKEPFVEWKGFMDVRGSSQNHRCQ